MGVNGTGEEVLARLTERRAGGAPVVTCYLKLEPRDRMRGKYVTKLKNRVKAVEEMLPRLRFGREEQDQARRDLGRVVDYLRLPDNLPPTRGVAVFAAEAEGLFEVVPLPEVYRSRLTVDRAPLVRELASIEEEFGRFYTVLIDRSSARFFEVAAHGAVEVEGITALNTRGKKFHRDTDTQTSEYNFNSRIREEKQRHFDLVAQRLFALDRRNPAHGIVLAGTGSEANGLRPFLHPYLAERVIGQAKLNPKAATPPEVHEATLDARETAARERERRAVEGVREGAGTGWAVNGIEGTLKALARGQVRVMLVQPDASVPGFRCADTARLTLEERGCRLEGDPTPVLDVVDEAIEEALRQGVEVNVVYDGEAGAFVEGLAALFRFR
jgi:peptide chain release factor subunit 1